MRLICQCIYPILFLLMFSCQNSMSKKFEWYPTECAPELYPINVVSAKLILKDHSAVGSPIHDSIIVDAAWNSVQKDMEYQGILYKTNSRIFHMGPLAHGTNNIGEFLAIVHALGYCKKHAMDTMPIYSDSRNAIGWVKAKKCKTNLEESPKTKHIFDLITRAENWLQENKYKNKILKWETKAWGENPADFGRK